MNASTTLPVLTAPRGHDTHRWIVLAVACVAQFMVVLDSTIVNVALPAIQTDLGFSDANLQWVVSGYTLLFGGFLLLGGRAADLFGRKRLFLMGIGLFTAASLLNALASSEAMLIGFRALQGLGAALVSPAGLSIVTTTFPAGAERTKALAAWGAVAAGGGAFGLLLGGLLTETLSWEWIFLINVPVGVAAVLASLRFLPESHANVIDRRFDVGGAVTVTAGLTALVYAVVKASGAGWDSTPTLVFGAIALGLFAAFSAIELRHPAPLVRLSIFRVRSLATANAAMLLVLSSMFAIFFFFILYVQQIMGYSPLKSGLAFLPVTVLVVAGSIAAARLIASLGVRAVVVPGLLLSATGLALLTRTTVEGHYLTEALPALMCLAVGLGMTFTPLTLIATTNVAAADAGLASGLLNTSQQVGGALGLAVLSTLATSRADSVLGRVGHAATAGDQSSAALSGYHLVYWIAAGLMVTAAALITVRLRSADIERIDAADVAPAMSMSEA